MNLEIPNMNKSKNVASLYRMPVTLASMLLALAIVAAACGTSDGTNTAASDAGADSSPTTAAMEDEAMEDDEAMSDDEAMEDDEAMSDDEAMEDEEHMEDDEAMADDGAAGVLDIELTDVDGVAFKLSDFAGTPVVVETFATWCPNCRAQLANNQEAAASAGTDAVFIALSTETDIDPAEVVAYATENGFTNIRFGVLSPEGLAAFNDQFGGTAINPPSTPHWIIDANGAIGDMETGEESAADILTSLELS